MLLAIGKCHANDLPVLFIYHHPSLQSVLFLFSRVKMLLLFFGLSMGVSVASMRMTSYSISLFRRAFRPGRAKSGCLMSVSFLKRVVKRISLALRVDARKAPPVKGEARAGSERTSSPRPQIAKHNRSTGEQSVRV